jgi:hypothetical protein
MLRSPLNDAPSPGGEARWHSLYSSAETSLSEYLNRNPKAKPGDNTLQGGVVMRTVKCASVLTLAILFLAGMAFAQTDPGVQSGNRGTGTAFSSVLSNSPSGILSFFTDGQKRFQDVESVSNSPAGNNGLGPRFNSNSCSSCHAQPAVGGTGAPMNPQFSFTSNGTAPRDTTPYFITATGPTLEARFPFFFNSNGSVNYNAPNGGVEDLFTVSGRSDAGTCSLPQPSFNTAGSEGNIIFRIPTPTFGEV